MNGETGSKYSIDINHNEQPKVGLEHVPNCDQRAKSDGEILEKPSPNLFESQSDISFKISKNKDHSSSDDTSVMGKESECNSRENNDHATTAGNSMSGMEIEDHSSSANESDLDIFTPKPDIVRRSRRIITNPQERNVIYDKKY